MESIREDDAFFASCLDLVPRRFVVPLTDEEKDELHARSLSKKQGSKKEKQQDQQSSASGKQQPREPKKPNAVLIQEAFLKEKKEAEQVLLQSNSVAVVATATAATASSMGSNTAKPEVSTVSELRARLQSRVEEYRKRAGTPGARAERDKLLPPKQKKVKVVAKEGGEGADAAVMATEQASAKPAAVPTAKAAPVAATPQEQQAVVVLKKKSTTKKPTIEERISYGALKMDEQKPKGESTSTSSILNVKKLIKKAQDGQARMEALKEQGKDHIVQEEKWDLLEKKAQGEKIRDDPKLLKKALKALEKKKEKASKARKERKQNEELSKKERIEQREKNIKERSKLQIQKRSGGRIPATPTSAAEKPTRRNSNAGGGGGGARARPGFEGRKTPSKKPRPASAD